MADPQLNASTGAGPRTGTVYFVGAGPGDPGLVTLRGAACLRRADCILYDYLVNPRILSHVRASAERICLGQHGRSPIWTQDEINTVLVAKARSGLTVVRLKGGDPAVFARGAEELLELVRQDVPYEVVPGITAALAASSYAGIPITHREWASAVALVTGHENDEKSASTLDYAALARFPGTLVFYMGVTTAGVWAAKLRDAGMDPATPVAIIRHCSLPDQHVVSCKLGDVEQQLIEPRRIRPPVIFVIGRVVTLGPILSWFSRRPLFGQSILVARPAAQVDEFMQPLDEAGAQVLVQPAIEIVAPDSWSGVDTMIQRLGEFQWLVFSSTNGVRFFLDRVLCLGRDVRKLGHMKIAAVGPGTAAALREYSILADLVPQQHRAEGLALELSRHVAGAKLLLVRANRGRELLAQQLTTAGAFVESVVAYVSRDVEQADPDILEKMRTSQIDWVAVTSSAIARSLVQLFGDQLKNARLISISPVTSATLQGLGYPPAAEAESYSMSGIVEVLCARSKATTLT